MAFVFGSHFVCKDSATAQRVAFHPEIMTSCVTLEGDVFSPNGLLTGGSRKSGGAILSKLHELSSLEKTLANDEAVLQATNDEIRSLSALEKSFRQLTGEVDLKSHQLTLIQSRIEQSEHHQLSVEVTAMESQLEAASDAATKAGEQEKSDTAKVASLEKEIKDYAEKRTSRLKACEKAIKAAKQNLATATKKLKAKEEARDRLVLEGVAANTERQSMVEQLASMEASLALLEEAVKEAVLLMEQKNHELTLAEAELKEKRQRVQECDKHMTKLAREQAKMKDQVAGLAVQRTRLNHKMKQVESDAKSAAKHVADLLHKCEWIVREKSLFGQPGTDYDFTSRDAHEAVEALEAKEAEQRREAKTVNKKVTILFEKAEHEYADLLRKKAIVQNDKSKIEQVIEELDEKKKEALQVTWQKVTKDFGSIFSTLLPGTTAKLDPPEGLVYMDGLEVKVAFGGVWKQSLSELSGGQRSLLALSLVLALLLFKPAPLYILDEVDAALDLSHTQNIGRMIKAHFPHSQFVVVSLKEGMFNNANVIFRTKFVDGISTVTRTVPAGAAGVQQRGGGSKKEAAAHGRRGALTNGDAHESEELVAAH
eukprot:TRINITY_DN15038_c0_g1_i1.p1 TRINITY_DN15038_c0_g1~~TRINITY_DN15038_c0_g1_i1.p1  ORF type:complete len:620 (-),score=157.40 TRINITY_DN15038_c0_g1_i1:125-1912(-)